LWDKRHSTTRSKTCLHHHQPKEDQAAVPFNADAEHLNDDDNAEEIEAFDALPLGDSTDSADPDGTTRIL
jgi:hypothetical protein